MCDAQNIREMLDLKSFLLDQLALLIVSLGRDLKALLQKNISQLPSITPQSRRQKENLPRSSRE